MLIEISTLPYAIQQQILAVEHGQVVQFVNNGKVIGKVVQEQLAEDSLNTTFGMWQGADGLAYERQVRDEWA